VTENFASVRNQIFSHVGYTPWQIKFWEDRESMAITAIITTYRRPQLLKRAINSVLKQTYSDCQVWVYDNASDDETEEIVRKLAEKDTRVKYHRHPVNIGMMPNYKFAFDRIDTPYFSLLSDDDYLMPCFYETAMKGFQDFPDAGFSACAVLQMDVNGNLVGNPLALWGSEGVYSPRKGLIEMLKTRWRFPVPTGVLFQTKIIQDIQPNFSSDVDFFWDPDYLIRIVARHPIVINKRACAVYLAHSQSFASSFYSKLIDDLELAEKYLTATLFVLKGIQEVPNLDPRLKQKAAQLFWEYIRNDACSFLNCYIKTHKFQLAHSFSKCFYIRCGFSFRVAFYHLKAIAVKCILFVLKWTKTETSISSVRGKILNHLKSFKDKIRKTFPRNVSPINLDLLKECHEYGQKLSDDNF